jgi:PAS domain S-box-containing protein
MHTARDETAARLASIVESSDDAIVSKDLNGYITSWNAAAERMFGYTRNEIVGKHITTIIPVERRAEEDHVINEIRQGRRVDHFETVRCRKDGSLIDVSLTISPIHAGDGHVIGASKIARDVTERKRLERDAFRLAAIVNSSDDAIVSKDLNAIVQTWNAGAERIFGFTAEEAIGRHITLIIPEDRLSEETLVISRIVAGESVEHFETVRRHKDGHLIDISLTVSPIRTARGDIIGASKIARDITEEKRLRRAAAEASRAKDEFLATLSHELRTPLNTVLGYTHMLQSGTLQPAGLEKALEAISRNGEALTKLVNDVLDASRIVTGKMHLNLERCDLAAIAREAVETIEPAIAAKGQRLQVEAAEGMILTGDPDRLRQVVWNLLSNAAKFTPVGGAITVRGEARERTFLLEVADTGSGIPADALPRIFERFWQVDSTHTRGYGGLGLGLSLVRDFIELHGGTVTAHSDGPGKGARFVIELPRGGPQKKKGGV